MLSFFVKYTEKIRENLYFFAFYLYWLGDLFIIIFFYENEVFFRSRTPLCSSPLFLYSLIGKHREFYIFI